MKKKQYCVFLAVLGCGSFVQGVNPEAFIEAMSEKYPVKLVVTEQSNLCGLEKRIQRVFKDIEIRFELAMETSIGQRGFFNVPQILESPEICNEIVKLGLGSDAYGRLIGNKDRGALLGLAADSSSAVPLHRSVKKGIMGSFRGMFKRSSIKKVESDNQSCVAQVDCDSLEQDLFFQKMPDEIVQSPKESLLEAKIRQLVKEEMEKTNKRLATVVEFMLVRRGYLDAWAVTYNKKVCTKVIRLGLDGVKSIVQEESEQNVSCRVQTNEGSFLYNLGLEVDDECIENELVRAKVASRVKMSMMQTGRRLAFLEAKRCLSDPKICAGIVRSGLGEEAYKRFTVKVVESDV